MAETVCRAIIVGCKLHIVCRSCRREVWLDDAEMVRMFILVIDARLDELGPRMKCARCRSVGATVGALGSRSTIRWRNPSHMAHQMTRILADREAELREWALEARRNAAT